MKYGKIFDYRNRDEAEIGKEYVFSDFCRTVFNEEIAETKPNLKLKAVGDGRCPFETEVGTRFQFIREVIEEEPALMTNRQLAEWLAKGNGQFKYDEPLTRLYHEYGPIHENESVNKYIRIRRWDSDEWFVPTVDIYERDCR